MNLQHVVKTGEKIRIHRVIKNYSQEYMSWCLGISQAAYSQIESGQTKVTVDRVYEIAEILEISAFELLPKPKFGITVNYTAVFRTMRKLSKFWTSDVRRKIGTFSDTAGVNRDISNQQER